MAIRLVTGVPGAGKTLYAVSRIVQPTLKTELQLDDGKSVRRRLVIGGIRDLLVEHEPMDVLTFDPESSRVGGELLDDRERKPGEPVLDVPTRADNWWLWCRPGDFIVIDECQRLFRPMASGRKLPRFISMLETHRHYGVDLLLITQHPMLLHASVRNLVGHHSHVRRMFGGAQTVVYEWDHCTNPDRLRDATKRVWRHDQKAFELYKSAEVHTKHKHGLPFAAYMLAATLIGLPILGYFAYERLGRQYGAPPVQPSVAISTPGATAPQGASPERPAAPSLPASSPAVVSRAQPEAAPAPIAWAGCIQFGPRCECIDAQGMSRLVELQFCVETVQRSGVGAVAYQTVPGQSHPPAAPQKREPPRPVPDVHPVGFNAGDIRTRPPWSSPAELLR